MMRRRRNRRKKRSITIMTVLVWIFLPVSRLRPFLGRTTSIKGTFNQLCSDSYELHSWKQNIFSCFVQPFIIYGHLKHFKMLYSKTWVSLEDIVALTQPALCPLTLPFFLWKYWFCSFLSIVQSHIQKKLNLSLV